MITLPAIKGKIGTTEYYLTSMSARELVSSVKPADELEEWESMTIEEKTFDLYFLFCQNYCHVFFIIMTVDFR